MSQKRTTAMGYVWSVVWGLFIGFALATVALYVEEKCEAADAPQEWPLQAECLNTEKDSHGLPGPFLIPIAYNNSDKPTLYADTGDVLEAYINTEDGERYRLRIVVEEIQPVAEAAE